MSAAKTLDGFASEPGFRQPSKFTGNADDFLFEETHEAREELWAKVKAGCKTSARKFATKYNVREVILKGKKII